jgi:hypothetical protein
MIVGIAVPNIVKIGPKTNVAVVVRVLHFAAMVTKDILHLMWATNLGWCKTEYFSTCMQLNAAPPDGSTAICENNSWLFLTTKEGPKKRAVEQRVARLMFIIWC